MSLNQLAVFQEYAYTTYTETVDQQVNLFNEASRGGIMLRTASHQGDFSTTAFWKNLAGLVRRRNAYGSGTVSALNLEHLLSISVKVAAGTPPVNIDPGMMKWIQRAPEEAAAVYGVQLAKATIQDMLNTALMATVAAYGAHTAITTDTSATAGGVDLNKLNTAASKFGDRAESLDVWVMHSKSLFDLYGAALTNTNRLFVFGTVRVAEDGFGRALIMTDSPALITAGTPNKYNVLGLRPGAVLVDQNDDFTQNIETKNGDENILRTIQSEWSYNLGLDGYAWDTAAGGKSPNNAAIGAAANWDKTATSYKDTGGVLLISQ